MKHVTLLTLLFVFLISGVNAQNKKRSTKKNTSTYPQSFTISKAEFDAIMATEVNAAISMPDNKYVDKSKVIIHTHNGDMQFVKVNLNYFPKSGLMIQVNGEYSTQIFLLSDDKTLSYKARVDKELITLTKCTRDEIVSE
ncbi:MAG: hypothetical protein IT236_14560 [Bacteroidia bacterium]|nr:hypothetical protein [Bacteroidia bacterium]